MALFFLCQVNANDVQFRSVMQAYHVYLSYLGSLFTDIGKVICSEMIAILDSKITRSLGFPVLISSLCFHTRVDVSSSDPSDTVRLQPVIRDGLYTPGEKAKRGQKNEA